MDLGVDNISYTTNGKSDLGFKVSKRYWRIYKGAANMRGLSMKDLLKESLVLWLQERGLYATFEQELLEDKREEQEAAKR
jgi:hypothetical protein